MALCQMQKHAVTVTNQDLKMDDIEPGTFLEYKLLYNNMKITFSCGISF